MSARSDAQLVVAPLVAALEHTADALVHADLDRLLTCEAEIAAALSTLRVQGLAPDVRGAVFPDVERARTALARCRRLGLALNEFARLGMTTIPGLGAEYGRRAATAPDFHSLNTTV
jgi:hypothetical protein